MDTFRKWLNKPKADDKSLLARFYHADRALTAVASELDSFDGRAEPDRCSRLVNRLRQGQDKVLSITNQIMDELLKEDRVPRTFRAKFPEEVLQENLAGQLWFGAECLAAGSSIMNREFESTAMRPLAKAVTKSLDNVRNLLRDQCLRNNIPNSPTLRLDINDAATEQLYESLKIFDRLFAEFEFRYVSAMVQVKSKHEYEMQELICVLFSESLQRALKVGLLEQDQVDSFDPALMFSIPRLAIITGLVTFDKGPLNMEMPADQLSEMFRPFRTILIKIRNLLRALNKNELFQLEKLLCTNEDIHLKSNNTTTNCDDVPDDKSNSDDDLFSHIIDYSVLAVREVFTDLFTLGGNTASSSISSDSSSEWMDEEKNQEIRNSIVTNDCNSGFLIPNTNLGNLLQTNDIPLTDNFISSDEEYVDTHNGEDDNKGDNDSDDEVRSAANAETSRDIAGSASSESTVRSRVTNQKQTSNNNNNVNNNNNNNRNDNNDNNNTNGVDLDMTTENTSTDQSPDLENPKEINQIKNFGSCYVPGWESGSTNHNKDGSARPGCSRMETTDSSEDSDQQATKLAKSDDNDFPGTSSNHCQTQQSQEQQQQQQNQQQHNNQIQIVPNNSHHHRSEKSTNRSNRSSQRHHHHHHHSQNNTSIGRNGHHHKHHSKKQSKQQHSQTNHKVDTSSGDTSSSLSDGDPHEITLDLRAACQIKFKSTENLLHRLFVCIAGVADQLQTNFASDLRQILRSVFLMNMTPPQDDIAIPAKTKDAADLFEFRASEHDVIDENAGSNQSIYSAEEVNPELDNVFADRTTATQRGGSLETDSRTVRSNISRSRSLGEEQNDNHHQIAGGGSLRTNSLNERRSSQTSNSGSNSPANSSTSSSPIGRIRSTTDHDQTTTTHCCPPTNVKTATDTAVNSSQSPLRQSPPPWIPDDEAPRCMACTIPFTAFRRRHHCRNCGGVFCGGCSNSSAPLPKYGLTKAVRVCRDCYVREVGT